jgi:transcriptional regulator with XRE-family HTH domain
MQLRAIRDRNGLTQKQLSEKSGISQPNISDVENGRVVPTVVTAAKLAKALNCTIDDLLDDKEHSNDATLPDA